MVRNLKKKIGISIVIENPCSVSLYSVFKEMSWGKKRHLSKHLLRLFTANPCPVPFVIPENALLSEREFHVGQNVSVKCREGFLLRGNGVITCNPDETWTQTNAKCESEWMGRAPWRSASVEGSSISQIF